jgi:hypothetical protein
MPDQQPAWHPEVLPNGWERAATNLAERSALESFYLAGGTGLALHHGHRRSVDLDLFRQQTFDPRDLERRLAGLSGLKVRQAMRGTLHLELRGILVSFLEYPYPLLFPLMRFGALDVADPRDIACMKLDAIANRGSRRDFIDLYLCAKTYGLDQILEWFGTKYVAIAYNRIHLFKALTYFVDAEREPMPDMLLLLDWTDVRQYFLSQVPRLSRLQ